MSIDDRRQAGGDSVRAVLEGAEAGWEIVPAAEAESQGDPERAEAGPQAHRGRRRLSRNSAGDWERPMRHRHRACRSRLPRLPSRSGGAAPPEPVVEPARPHRRRR